MELFATGERKTMSGLSFAIFLFFKICSKKVKTGSQISAIGKIAVSDNKSIHSYNNNISSYKWQITFIPLHLLYEL